MVVRAGRLLGTVCSWIDVKNYPSTKQSIDKYLRRKFPEWLAFLEQTARRSWRWAVSNFNALKKPIVAVCRSSRVFLDKLERMGRRCLLKPISKTCKMSKPLMVEVSRLGAKTAGRITVKTLAESAAKTTVKSIAKAATKTTVKSFTKAGTKAASKSVGKVATKLTSLSTIKSVSKVAAKMTASATTKTASKAVVRAVSNPVSIGADIAQAVFEGAGFKEAGKAVGVSGNVLGAGVAGLMAAGPLGGALGLVVGGAMWLGGEFVGNVTEAVVNEII